MGLIPLSKLNADAERRATRHTVTGIDFKQNLVHCSCGESVTYLRHKRALDCIDWNAHKRAVNERLGSHG